jgi:Flp pilus assembly protein TadB
VAATRPAILMLMIVSLICGVMAILMSLVIGISLIIALPGLVIGAFFAFRYMTYDRSKHHKEEQEESQKRKRKRRSR